MRDEKRKEKKIRNERERERKDKGNIYTIRKSPKMTENICTFTRRGGRWSRVA